MMTSKTRRALLAVLFSVGGALTLTAGAAAATPSVATAPGRIVVSLDGTAIAHQDASGGGRDVAALTPSGNTLVAAGGGPGQVRIVELTANGALAASFGIGGVASVALPSLPGFGVHQIVVQPDGDYVLVGTAPSSSKFGSPQLAMLRFNPDGTLDTSFGNAGLDEVPIGLGCSTCVAPRPGGGFVVAGTSGDYASSTPASPGAQPQTRWVVAGLTSTGALDPSFGQAGLVTLAGLGSSGSDVAALANGDIVTDGVSNSGHFDASTEFTRLLPSGAQDPTFNGGALEYLPSRIDSGMLAYPDGTVVFGLQHAIVRYTAAGLPDAGFGTGGIVQVGSTTTPQTAQLLPSAGDGALVVLERECAHCQDHEAVRIAADGAVDPSLGGAGGQLSRAFGGGSSGALITGHPQQLPPLDQNTFSGTVLARADGSFELLGDVFVSQSTGEGEGLSIDDLAAGGLTSSFALDTSFGGPVTRLRATLALIKQRSSTALHRHGIRVTLNVSAPGLARVVIKASGRVIAQNVLPVFHAGPAQLPVELTTFGKTWLRGHPQSRVTASLKARDLLTNTATATAEARLR